MIELCAVCGHRHEGPGLGGICVGCPCEVRRFGPAARGLSADEVGFLVRQVEAMMRRRGCPQSEADGHSATLEIIEWMVNQAPRYIPGESVADN